MSMPVTVESDNLPPDVVIGYVSVRSKGRTSFLEAEDVSDPAPFHASAADGSKAEQAIERSGLEIVAESALGRSVAGPPEAFEELTGGTVATVERLMATRVGRVEYVTHLDVVGSGQPDALGVGKVRAAAIEAVVLERPRAPLGIFPAPIPPSVGRFHLRVPDDVATLLSAAPAHLRGRRGAGTTVAIVDTGWFRHPFFTAHGYVAQTPVTVVPGTNPAQDPHGHGTGESANIFAIAPETVLRPFRAADNRGRLVGAMAGFIRAKAGRPDVITNSWGGDYRPPFPAQPDAADLALALEIRDAIAQNIVVVFAAGNGSYSAEAQVPGVLSAGGVFATAATDLQASNYASGYRSPWFGGVDVPLVSGLVGMLPRAAYIMLPIPPGCTIDVDSAMAGSGGAAADPPDGTTGNDGWALFSGTSAAAPQLAGAAAVLRGVRKNATPAKVAQALTSTAVDVRMGRCHPRFNNAATAGRDLATGFGLVNVAAAAGAI